MTSNIDTSRLNSMEAASALSASAADAALKCSARLWFATAVIGQWIFVYYILSFYGGAAIQGNFGEWNTVLPHGYEAGNTPSNLAIATHLLFAAIITFGGPLQLVPQIRSRLPAFHRWNGRLYIPAALIMGVSGLYLSFSGRTTVGGLSQTAGLALNGLLIIVFAILALRYALARDFKTHRRWALRLFLAVSGVWFFRVGLMLWLFIHRAPVGFDPQTFQGPFLSFLDFAQYLLPLAVLEIYFYTQDRCGTSGRLAMAAGLLILTLAMGMGILAVTMGLWLPRIQG